MSQLLTFVVAMMAAMFCRDAFPGTMNLGFGVTPNAIHSGWVVGSHGDHAFRFNINTMVMEDLGVGVANTVLSSGEAGGSSFGRPALFFPGEAASPYPYYEAMGSVDFVEPYNEVYYSVVDDGAGSFLYKNHSPLAAASGKVSFADENNVFVYDGTTTIAYSDVGNEGGGGFYRVFGKAMDGRFWNTVTDGRVAKLNPNTGENEIFDIVFNGKNVSGSGVLWGTDAAGIGAFLVPDTLTVYQLPNVLGGTPKFAIFDSNSGYYTGVALDSQGREFGFVTDGNNSTPEPSTFFLAAIGAAILLLARRGKKN